MVTIVSKRDNLWKLTKSLSTVGNSHVREINLGELTLCLRHTRIQYLVEWQ